jgi:hypothetical protein
MPYDVSKDPYATTAAGRDGFGRKSRAVTPNDSTDLDPYARVVCVSTGNISVVPVENADNVPVPFLAVAAGFVVPFQVRRVMSTGTTATVYTIDS